MTTPTSSFSWPQNAKASVCLCYDDGMPCHVDLVAPVVEVARWIAKQRA